MLQGYKNKKLYLAVNENNLGDVIKYVGKGGDIEIEDFLGRNLVDLAASNRNYEIFKYLLDNGAKVKDRQMECLFEVIRYGRDIKYLEALVEKGVNLSKTKYGGSALELATSSANISATNLLLDQDIVYDSRIPNEANLVKRVATLDNVEIFKKLIDKLNLNKDALKTALIESLKEGYFNITDLISVKYGLIKEITSEEVFENFIKEEGFEAIEKLIEKDFDIQALVGFLNQYGKIKELKQLSKNIDLGEEIDNQIKKQVNIKYSMDDKNTVSKKIVSKDKSTKILKFFQFASEEVLTVVKSKDKKTTSVIRDFRDIACDNEINDAYKALIELGGNSPIWRPKILKEKNTIKGNGLIDLRGRKGG